MIFIRLAKVHLPFLAATQLHCIKWGGPVPSLFKWLQEVFSRTWRKRKSPDHKGSHSAPRRLLSIVLLRGVDYLPQTLELATGMKSCASRYDVLCWYKHQKVWVLTRRTILAFHKCQAELAHRFIQGCCILCLTHIPLLSLHVYLQTDPDVHGGADHFASSQDHLPLIASLRTASEPFLNRLHTSSQSLPASGPELRKGFNHLHPKTKKSTDISDYQLLLSGSCNKSPLKDDDLLQVRESITSKLLKTAQWQTIAYVG